MALARNLVLTLSLIGIGPWASVTAVGAGLSDAPAIRLCGRRLADLVWMICMDRGGVHSHMDRRALSTGRSGDDDGATSAEAVATTIAPEPAANSARYHSSQGQYSSGGIVEECCRKPCSFSTLASYCARPSDSSSLDTFNLPPEPSTTTPPRVVASSRLQTAHEVDREHNEVDNAGPHRRLGAVSRHTTGRALLPSMPFLTSPEDDAPFATRPRIGTFSRHRPYWYVVQAAFNGDADDER
ncbi:hypothetical protein MRX96_025551 [Rhipicephalus microplus]